MGDEVAARMVRHRSTSPQVMAARQVLARLQCLYEASWRSREVAHERKRRLSAARSAASLSVARHAKAVRRKQQILRRGAHIGKVEYLCTRTTILGG